jgi:hypothetical protein
MAVDIPAAEESGEPGDDDAAAPDAAAEARPPLVRAILINGGSSAAKNYLSHFHHLQDMVAALRARGIPAERIDIFSGRRGSGEGPGHPRCPAARLRARRGDARGPRPAVLELTNSAWKADAAPRVRASCASGSKTGRSLRAAIRSCLRDRPRSRNADDPGNGLSLWGDPSVLNTGRSSATCVRG